MTIKKLMPARCFSFHDTRLYDRLDRLPVPSSKFVLLPFGELLPYMFDAKKKKIKDDVDNDDAPRCLVCVFVCEMCRFHLDVNGRFYCSNAVIIRFNDGRPIDFFSIFLCAHETTEMNFMVGRGERKIMK